jgi:tRNA-specific 2-thiouridylase
VSERSTRVVVAMSGGVDSSVAAALLVEQGYQVIGMMLRLWSESGREEDNRCCTPDAMALARRIAAKLGIPFYAIDAQQVHYQAVVQDFIAGYQNGITPNPCLACNRQVRWGFLLERALALGATHMATGHYAHLRREESSHFQLLQSADPAKDQSYVLHVLNQPQLAHALFPLGTLTKSQVRQKAHALDLPVAQRADSQDLCFLSGGDYRDFLARNAPQVRQPGPIQTRAGVQVGSHDGLAFYTIGQRKGLGIASSKPMYVLAKDTRTNTLVVGEAEEMGSEQLVAAPMHWIDGAPPAEQFRAQVKIRYKAEPASATVSLRANNSAFIRFDRLLRDITPGQAAVIYQDEVCLGGGIIQPPKTSREPVE